MTVGICGVGTMGRKAAKHLQDAGFSVHVFDVSNAAVDALSEAGMAAADSPKALGSRCEVVLLFLPGPKQIREALQGADGLLIAQPLPGVVVDMSTVDPTFTKGMYKAVTEAGSAYLDAPVLGRPDSVGKWVLPVGGQTAALETAKAVLEPLSASVVHAGPSGSGNQLKLLNQLMFGAINGITAEVMAIAERLGVSKQLFYETIAGSSAATVSPLFKELGRRVVEERYDEPTFTVDLLFKDVSLGLSMADDGGAPVVIGRAVDYLNRMAQQQGHGSRDTSVMWEALLQTWNHQRGTRGKE